MRTNIEISDQLMDEVLRLSKAKTKKDAVEEALRHYLRLLHKRNLLALKGKINWEGSLDDMRTI